MVKGRYLDNIFVERLWRSIKYEKVYLKAYQTVPEARTGIDAYLEFWATGPQQRCTTMARKRRG